MWRPILIIILIFGALFAVYWYLNKPQISAIDPSPINPEKVPYQSVVVRPFAKPFSIGELNVSISPRVNYTINARILSRRKYVSGWQSKLSKWDIVFGWGDAANLNKIENLDLRQSVRWYTFRISANVPMSGPYIASHTSNHHIIPGSENVRRALLFLKKYDLVQMTGYLVDVHGKNGRQNVSWQTSLSREDTGDGACEIFLVESIKVGDKVYR